MSRRDGKTTRLIDSSIQLLFENGRLILSNDISLSDVIDADYAPNNFAQRDFIDRVIRRLYSEHDKQFKIEKKKDYIEIIVKYE